MPAPRASAEGRPAPEGLKWHDFSQAELEGRAFSHMRRMRHFDRFPADAHDMIPERVWEMSRHTAGMALRFKTDAASISVDYKLALNRLYDSNITPIAASGVDLYARDDNGAWRWVAVSLPTQMHVRQLLVEGLAAGTREYLLYLPLFNAVDTLRIGVEPTASLEPLSPREEQPIVFYGTSITHGISASRAGMCHVAMLGRRFDRPIVNLGFAGNGRMDIGVGDLLCEIDAAVYVIDCLPNMPVAEITERCGPIVRRIREKRPETPIVLVEERCLDNGWIVPDRKRDNAAKNAALREEFRKLLADGVQGLHYIAGDNLFGLDAEGTCDSSHPTDLGFVRQADVFEPVLRKVLSAKSE